MGSHSKEISLIASLVVQTSNITYSYRKEHIFALALMFIYTLYTDYTNNSLVRRSQEYTTHNFLIT